LRVETFGEFFFAGHKGRVYLERLNLSDLRTSKERMEGDLKRFFTGK